MSDLAKHVLVACKTAPCTRHKSTKEALCMNNGCKPKWADSQLGATLAKKPLEGLKELLLVEYSKPGPTLCKDGYPENQRDILLHLDEQGTVLSVNMYRSLLKACAKRKALTQAKQVYVHLAEHGLAANTFLGECVVSTLVKCDGLEDALEVFHRLPHRSVFSWTAVIAGYSMSGQFQLALQMYQRMQEDGVQPNTYTFVSLLKACGSVGDLQQGVRIHEEVVKYRCESDMFVGTCLVDMYAKCGSILDAQIVFDGLPQRNVVSWTAILSAYAQQRQAAKALQLYERMQEEGVSPDDRTFMCLLQACGMLAEETDPISDEKSTKEKCLGQGKALHAEAWRNGYSSDVFVASTLVSMYGRCGSILDAQNVFDGFSSWSVVPWNAMLSASARGAQPDKAFQLYEQMRVQGVSPNDRTFVSVLQACSMLAEKEHVVDGRCINLKVVTAGKVLHAEAWKRGFDSDIYVGNTLVSMYMKCGCVVDAQNVFNGLSQRDVVSWNVILTAFVEQGQPQQALVLYKQMLEEGIRPDEITLACVLQACGSMGSLDVLRQMHHSVVCCRNTLSQLLATTLIHSYARCSSMVEAQTLFDGLPRPDVVSWNALMAGYARQGNCAATLQCYQELQMTGCRPDAVTFLSVLSSCGHAGLVDIGVESFESMSRDFGITPHIEHYVSLVDLLARAGCFARVEELLSVMPMQPSMSLWLCLLGACRTHGKTLLGKQAFDGAVHLEPKHPAAYVLIWNIYADAGLWDLAQDIETKLNVLRQEAGAWKQPGKSWIEHGKQSLVFLIGDHEQPQQESLLELLEQVNVTLKAEGRTTTWHEPAFNQKRI